ncbi:hypothetical protein Dimus_012483 [Dionaea muscipula]
MEGKRKRGDGGRGTYRHRMNGEDRLPVTASSGAPPPSTAWSRRRANENPKLDVFLQLLSLQAAALKSFNSSGNLLQPCVEEPQTNGNIEKIFPRQRRKLGNPKVNSSSFDAIRPIRDGLEVGFSYADKLYEEMPEKKDLLSYYLDFGRIVQHPGNPNFNSVDAGYMTEDTHMQNLNLSSLEYLIEAEHIEEDSDIIDLKFLVSLKGLKKEEKERKARFSSSPRGTVTGKVSGPDLQSFLQQIPTASGVRLEEVSEAAGSMRTSEETKKEEGTPVQERPLTRSSEPTGSGPSFRPGTWQPPT